MRVGGRTDFKKKKPQKKGKNSVKRRRERRMGTRGRRRTDPNVENTRGNKGIRGKAQTTGKRRVIGGARKEAEIAHIEAACSPPKGSTTKDAERKKSNRKTTEREPFLEKGGKRETCSWNLWGGGLPCPVASR